MSDIKIHSYVMSFLDDQDVLADAISSLAHFSDHIFVVDGGMENALCHNPRFRDPIFRWINQREESGLITSLLDKSESHWSWSGIPLTLWEHAYLDPGNQRGWITGKMESLPDQPDWVCWIDSDEVCSWEMIKHVRPYLRSLPLTTKNVVLKWLNMVQDEQHCVGGQHSTWLSHGRLYRPKTISWSGGYHENQVYESDRSQFDVRILHTRALYRRRLLVQRGHPVIKGRSRILPNAPQFWDDAFMEEIPQGVTWPTLHWPEGEIPLQFDQDASEIWDATTGILLTNQA